MSDITLLEEIDLHVTTRCNLACEFCSVKANEHSYPDLSLPHIKEIIATAKTLGLQHLHLTGGEPTLRNDLEEIVSFAAKQNIETRLITNGSLLNHQRLLRLRDAGLVNLMVSIDALAATHNKMRGHDKSWDLAMDCVVAALGLGFKVRVSSAVFKYNISGIPELMEALSKIKVHIFSIFLGSPLGRGEAWKNQVVSPDEWQGLLQKLKIKISQKDFNPSMQVIAEQGYIWLKDISRLDLDHLRGRGRGCITIGEVFDYLIIRGDGNVYPCIFALHHGEALGNIIQQSLLDIISKNKNGNPYKAWTKYQNGCYDCKVANLCHSGCRGYAFLYFNDWFKKDPRCFLEKANELPKYFPLCPIAKLNLRTSEIGGSSEQALSFEQISLKCFDNIL